MYICIYLQLRCVGIATLSNIQRRTAAAGATRPPSSRLPTYCIILNKNIRVHNLLIAAEEVWACWPVRLLACLPCRLLYRNMTLKCLKWVMFLYSSQLAGYTVSATGKWPFLSI